jgi:hypothetical protein
MQLALASEDEDFVEWVVRRVASAALEPPEGLDVPDMDEVADWIEHVTPRFPSATDWLEQSWSVPLDHWRGDNFRRETRYRAEHEHARAQRIAQYAPLLEKLGKEPLHAGVLSDVAHAYQKHFLDIDGVTPQARIEDLLGTSGDATRAVLAALDATLERDDLPSVDEILKLDSRQRMHPIRPAVLLAAQRATQDDPDSYWQWPEQLRSKLVAFFLTEGMGDEPPWYKGLASNCPDIVAPILVRYASSRLRRVGRHTIAGVWALARDDGLQRLVELTLPDLLEHFPIRASEAARDILNQSLLPALPRLSATHAAEIVRQKLGEPKLDSGQRIAWLVSLLPFDASASSHLVDVVGRNPRRIAMLGKALREQGTLGRTHHELAPFAVQRLVALLAPVTPYEPNWPGGIVDEPRQREETVKALLDNLGRNPTVEAAEALKALAAARTMGHWQRLVEYQVQAQRAVHREATFRALGPSDVARLLANGPPAQISDLAALVFDQIQTMEGRLRGDSSFQLRQFWDKDNKPRPEDWCRDALANQLGLLLKSQKVDVQPESQAAAKKRVDLRATLITDSGVRLSLPIEAKKDNHRLVWTAWRDQLQWLYTTDPDAQGFGIYLVFWFDHESMPSPEGVRPSSAEAFASQIRARMPESDRHRLLVYALDLSWPPQAKR